MNTLYVYGTLRQGIGEAVLVKGVLYDLGRYPGIKLGGEGSVVCEKITVSDEELTQIDRYEGYLADTPEMSLFVRKPYGDGFIYEYNEDVTHTPVIESGDWFKHIEEGKQYAKFRG